MNIIYYFRNPIDGISIGKVFETIYKEISKENGIYITKIYMPYKSISIIKNLFYAWRHRKKSDLYHITGGTLYLAFILQKNKTITTIHDYTILDKNRIHGIKKIIYKIFYLYPLKYNKLITCVSEYTKERLLCQINIDPKKIIIIPNAISTDFTFNPKKINKQRPIILHIGTAWNKNLIRTIIALQKLDIHLRIIGKLNDETLKLLKQTNTDYSNDYDVSDKQITEEYKQCDFVNFPSEYEGFGLPIIEGQAIGRVVITSNLSPMKEVAGDGAYFVDPYDINSIHTAYINLINNENLREQLIKKGLSNSKKYSVEHIASQYIHTYKYLING